MMGPNVKRLVIEKMSVDAIPAHGGVGDVLRFLTEPGSLSRGLREAHEWTKAAIQVVRLAAEPNEWKNVSDEEIAGELLRRLAERRKKVKRA